MMNSIYTSSANTKALLYIFIGTFIYALAAMTVSRELIIPSFLAGIDGHIPGDPHYYHMIAMNKASIIKSTGFSEFELMPNGQGAAGIASIAYLIHESPYGIVFINAILHGISAVVMSMILLRWFSLKITAISILPLIISPYMIIWFSQINKDSFVLAGSLLCMCGLINMLSTKKNTSLYRDCISLMIFTSGVILIWIMRPYVNQILLPAIGTIFSINLIYRIANRCDKKIIIGVYGVLAISITLLFGHGGASGDTIRSIENKIENKSASTTEHPNPNTHVVENKIENKSASATCLKKTEAATWRNEKFIPDYIGAKLRVLMMSRCLIFSILETDNNPTTLESFVDYNIFPSSSLEALYYLPRAMAFGIFSPFPKYWNYIFNHRASFFYTIVPIETILLYIGLSSLCLYLYRVKQWILLAPLGIYIFVASTYGMSTPLIGTLYRYRYPWYIIMICIGISAALALRKSGIRAKIFSA